MGSGVALVVASYIKNVVGVAVEAPAVRLLLGISGLHTTAHSHPRSAIQLSASV